MNLKPQLLIKSGHYNVPSLSTALGGALHSNSVVVVCSRKDIHMRKGTRVENEV